MKSTVAVSQLIMLSTSLLCLSLFAIESSFLTEENKEMQRNAEGIVLENRAAQQTEESSTLTEKNKEMQYNAEGIVLENRTAQQTEDAKHPPRMPMNDKSTQAKKKSCSMGDNPHRFEIKHIEAKGIGYNQGYTSLDAFFTGNLCNFIPFIDLRAHIFNNGKWASNVGIGTRYVIDPCQSMVGINAYYDYRSTKHFHYNQMGAGIEAYYDRFEFLVNGYLPVGRKRARTSHELQSIAFSHFSGNYIIYNTNYKNKYEGAMKGFNAEVGSHIAGDMKNLDLYFGIGPYYYDLKEGKHAWGGKARLKAEVSKYLFLEISDSWDRIFHNRFQGSVNVSIPFGGRKCYGKKRTNDNCSNVMDWLATLPVDRQEIIVVDKYKKNQTIDPVAINPATGQPFYVVFVDNANTVVGSGTFESPFSYLSHSDNPSGPNAQDGSSANNIIYVFPGNGTNVRMSTGMVLQSNQRMLGSAIAHTVATTDGVLTIPAQSTMTPFITGTTTGPSQPAIAINVNNCEVSGFNIAMQTLFPAGNQALSSDGVGCIAVANTANVTNVTITNNAIVNETWGILLGNNTTPFYIQGNVLINNNVVSMHTSSVSATGTGILVTSSRNANILIEDNQVSFNPTVSMIPSNGMFLRLGDQVQATVLNNYIDGISGVGIITLFVDPLAVLPSLTATCILQGNTITSLGNAGISASSSRPATTPGSIKMIVEGNTVTNETVLSNVTANANSSLLLRFNDNIMSSLVFNVATNATLYVEPPVNNTTSFSLASGSGAITPIVPCQYGGSGCPQ